MLNKHGNLAYLISLKMDKFPFISFPFVLISLGVPSILLFHLLQTFKHVFHNFPNPLSFETFSETHYPPPVLIKHHFWYLDNANLFVSIWGTLYEIHHTYFKPFHYFQNLLDCINPMFTIPQGYLPKQPIPSNNLNTQLFSCLLSYL